LRYPRGEKDSMERFKCRPTVFAFVVVLCWCAPTATAACKGSSPTWTAASAARNDVADCISAASPGDTIHVPAGTVSWGGTIGVYKSVSIIGAGASATRVSLNGRCFDIGGQYNVRISGFGFTDCGILVTVPPSLTAPVGFQRIDHNSFTSGGFRDILFRADVSTPMQHPQGLVDNNTFTNYRVLVYGTFAQFADSNGTHQHQLWAQPPPRGATRGGQNIVYIEDNVFTGQVGVHQNWSDANFGGRRVARFNRIVGNTYFENHSIQANNRAGQWWEVYRNTVEQLNGQNMNSFVFYLRGGSGLVWGNRIAATMTVNHITLNNIRSCRPVGTAGRCNGSSSWDQNASGQGGWGCRDQIGRSQDNSQWSHITSSAYAQDLTPAYFFDNIKGASTLFNPATSAGEACDGGVDMNATHIRADRDYYQQVSSFNGTTGVGVGPLANRPATCTVGVGYWATDQGEWNSKVAGPDGQLYRCTAPNTWSLHYIPYTYPHPMQGGPSVTPPAPPTSLSVVLE
jgi:hypothetical protein